jgi:putative ABC transport system permease protein
MRWLRAWLLRFSGVFGKERSERELAEEMECHLQMHIEDNLRAGMSAGEARRQALIKLGGVEATKETYRERRGLPVLEALVQDVRYAARTLRKNPGFTIVAVSILALGIGANTTIFQMLDAVTMRSLPVSKPEEIVLVEPPSMGDVRGNVEFPYPVVTNPLWEEIRRRQTAFSGIFAWSPGLLNLSQNGEARWASGLEVSGGFFSALGVSPALGRVFGDADDQRGCSGSAVLSYSFWQSEYGGDPAAVGQTITLEHHSYEITGVTSANFTGLEVGKRFDVAVPLCAEGLLDAEDDRLNSSTNWWLIVMGRLKPGLTIEKASAQLSASSPGAFEASLRPDYPKESIPKYLQLKLAARPAGGGISRLRESYSNSLWLLLTLTGLVLLIACANLANLMLARASARERELTMRAALGASRARLLSQTLTESALLAATGAALGIWLATLLSRLLVQFLSTEDDPLFLPLHLDWRTLGFTSGIALATCILFSVAPALRGMGVAPSAALKSSSRNATPGRGRFLLRRVLVVSQMAFSLMLLVEALLFTRSFVNLATADTGLKSQGVLISYLDLSRVNLPVERRLDFRRDLIQKLEQIPGVDSVAETNIVPLSRSSWNNNIWMEGSDPSHQTKCFFSFVGPGFFKTMGVAVLTGRNFLGSDTPASNNVAIVNEAFVREVLRGGSPLGLRFSREATPHNPVMQFEIVGVVKDAKYRDLREPPSPTIYLPQSQDPHPATFAQVLVRSSLPPSALLASVKSNVAQISPDITATFRVFDAMVRDSLMKERLMAWLSSFFGLLAILLAAIGLYGVISYLVAQRTNEVGIRMALGASGSTILKMLLGETSTLLVIGCVVGAALSFAAGRAASAFLYGLKPYDPVTFALALSLLAGVATAASYVPAQRAARVDPMVALRYE